MMTDGDLRLNSQNNFTHHFNSKTQLSLWLLLNNTTSHLHSELLDKDSRHDDSDTCVSVIVTLSRCHHSICQCEIDRNVIFHL